jgi:poly(3-hydroxyalkanoate) synthetase
MKSLVEQQKINFKHLAMRVFDADKLVLSQSTPYQVIAEFKQTRVRFYASENKRYKEPLVFTAPLAINMDIYDLYPYRSLIKHFQESGFDVYLIDWGKLTYKNYQVNFLSLSINLFHVVLRRFKSILNLKKSLCMVGVWLEFLSHFTPLDTSQMRLKI